MEIELKFSVPDRATFDRLLPLRALAGYRLEPVGIKRVHDRYLDTDDRAILQAGYACRVRHKAQGSGRLAEPPDADTGGSDAPVPAEGRGPEPSEGEALIATLKGLGGADAGSGIHQRAEHEVRVNGLDVVDWPEGRVRDLVLALSNRRPLHELFALRQERHVRLLYSDAPAGARQVAELSLDIVAPAGPGRSAYFELEIELLDQGRASDLHDLAADLKAKWGLGPEPRSKFERGLALMDDRGTR